MKYKYQLIILGENEELLQKIRADLFNKFDELKLIHDLLKIINKDNIDEYLRIPVDTRSPIPVISVHSVCNLQYRWQS